MSDIRIIIIISFFLFSCNNQKRSQPSNVFRYNESRGIVSLDPAFARDQTMIWPALQLFNGLVQMDEHLKVKPSIAKSWEISNDGMIYTFHLRDDVFFHDHSLFTDAKGRKVTAYDFEYSFSRILDPMLASPGLWIFSKLDRKNENHAPGFKALNDSTFRIWLSESFPPFLGILTMPYCSVLPAELKDSPHIDISSEPIGTGPFRFKLWRREEKLILVKNPNYFETDSTGKSLPYLDGVSISFIKDKQSEFMEFLLGNIDFLSGLHAVYKDELSTRDGKLNPKYELRFHMDTHPYLNTEYLGFLQQSGTIHVNNHPLSNLNLRKAINFGFDRSKMLMHLRNNMGDPAIYGFLPDGLPHHEPERIKGFDYYPDSVYYYLDLAGYPKGAGLPEITLTTTSDYLDLSEFIQYELSRFGITINLDVATGGAYRNKLANGHLIFFRGSWIADYPDPENYLSLFYSKNRSPAGPNYTQFDDPYYDSLYLESLKISDPRKREKIYESMDQYLMNKAVVVPLFYDKVVRFYPSHIQNLNANPLNLLILKNVKKE
ncbi:MAG: ABC transporter substrate-binding protein [Bacteroidota bacterium]